MSYPTELLSSLPAEPTGDSAENEPAATISGPAIHEETYSFDPPLRQRSPPPLLMIYGTGPSNTMD